MKTTNLLFTAQMVCRTLELKKNQTRRVLDPQPPEGTNSVEWNTAEEKWVPWNWASGVGSYAGGSRTGPGFDCPHGRIGDRIRVRESYRFPLAVDDLKPRDVPKGCLRYFPAGGGPRPEWAGKLRPGIFLPNWASRIQLEIQSLRVERLEKIVEGDARAEGAEPMAVNAGNMGKSGMSAGVWYREGFAQLWDGINARRGYPWGSGVFVWVIGYRIAE